MQSVLILPSAGDLVASDVGHLAKHLHHWSKLGGQILPSIAIPKTYLSQLLFRHQLDQKLATISELTQDSATLYHALLQTLTQLPLDDEFKRQYWPNILNVLGEGPYLMQSSLADAQKKHPSLEVLGNSLIWEGVLKLWAQYLAEKLTHGLDSQDDLAPTIVISRLPKKSWQGNAYLDHQNFNRAHVHLVSPDSKNYSFVHDASRGWEITPHFSAQQNEALSELARKLTAYQRHHLDPIQLNFDLTGDEIKVRGIHHQAREVVAPATQTLLGRTLNNGTNTGVLVSSLTRFPSDQTAVIVHLSQFNNFNQLTNFGKIAGIVCDQPIPASYLKSLCQLHIPVIQLNQPIPQSWWNCEVTLDGNTGTLFRNATTRSHASPVSASFMAKIDELPSLWQKKNLHQLRSNSLWLNWPKEESNHGWGNQKSILKSWQSIVTGMAVSPTQIVWQPPKQTNLTQPSFTQLITNQAWLKSCAQVHASLSAFKNVPVTMIVPGVKTPADWLLASHTITHPIGLEITNGLLLNEWSIFAHTPPSFVALNTSKIWQSYLGVTQLHAAEYPIDEKFIIHQLHTFKNELTSTSPTQNWWVMMDKPRPNVLATVKSLGAGVIVPAKDVDQANWLITKN